MNQFRFVVPGPPRPKERARRGKGGRWYTPRATTAFEAAVGWAARAAGARRPSWPCAGPVRLTLRLWFGDRRRRDADNVAKAVQDALNGIAWLDDCQVVELSVTRGVDPGSPRTEATVEQVAGSPPVGTSVS